MKSKTVEEIKKIIAEFVDHRERWNYGRNKNRTCKGTPRKEFYIRDGVKIPRGEK